MAIHTRLFIALLALLPVQLGYHLWPSWTMVLGRRIDYLSPTVYVSDILIVALVASWLWRRSERVAFAEALRHHGTLAWVGIVGALINIGVAESPVVAWYAWVKVFEYILLAWYVVRTKPNSSLVATGFATGVIYTSVIAILQFVFQHSVGMWILGERAFFLDTPGIARLSWCPMAFWHACRETLRAYGTFPHPNVLGGYLSVVLPVLYYTFVKERSDRRQRIVYACAMCLGTIALVVSFSRSAWVVTGAVAVVLARLLPTGKGKPTGFLWAAVFVGMIAVGFHPNFSDASVLERTALAHVAVSLWQHAPITGVGAGNFLVAFPRFFEFGEVGVLQPVHNIYLLFLSETGLLGVFGILLVLRRFLRRGIRMVIPYGVVLIGILTLGMVDHYIYTLEQGQIMFALVVSLFLSRI